MQKTSKFKDDAYIVTYKVEEDNHNKRLDSFLQVHFTSFSREKLKKIISNGSVQIKNRDQKLKSSTKVKIGEIVQITSLKKDFPKEKFAGLEIQEEEFEIIKQSDHYIAINKPPFMAAHPTGKHLFYSATVEIEKKLGFKVNTVHRLDRETSGVMVLSKNPEFAQIATDLFENRKVQKVYFLISHIKKNKKLPFDANEELGFIENFTPELYTHCFELGSARGKASLTRFKEIMISKGYLLALAFPKTGRQHQIRAHAAFHGYPLLGDKLYNGDPNVFSRFKDKLETKDDIELMQIPRHALHAVALKLPSPINEVFKAKLPQDLSKWIKETLDIDLDILDKKIAELIKEYL